LSQLLSNVPHCLRRRFALESGRRSQRGPREFHHGLLVHDYAAGPLNSSGATGGPVGIASLPFYIGINATGEVKTTTDPGRALVTGLWADVGKTKGPILRGLAGRTPYFHNGSALTLNDVITFYNKRFNIGFTQQNQQDLVAFLSSL
jgi:hypothetical protein